MPRPFSKYHGTGNDFLLIDDRERSFPTSPAQIRQLCHRRYGVGADGLILLQPSVVADFRMRIFNCDGLEAKMCGNGLRCLMHFLRRGGEARRQLSIETAGGLYPCHFEGERVVVDMGDRKSVV